MTTIELSPEAAEKVRAIGKLWDMTDGETVAHIADRFHAAYVKGIGKMPAGWVLREDLSLGDLEAYYDIFNKEPSGGAWVERASTLRAAIAAGWITADKKLTPDDVKALKPAQAVAAKNAIDALYVRLVTDDPN